MLDEIRQRQKRVLLVAGSGLYLQALLYGLMPAPAACAPLRRALRGYADQSWDASAAPAPPASRSGRGIVLSSARSRATHPGPGSHLPDWGAILTASPASSGPRASSAVLGIALTRERADLYTRIAERTDAMLAAGWLAEVERLVASGYTRACAAMNSLGYRELLAYMAGEMQWDETVAAIKKATCHLAKRQLTWFRKMPRLHWFNLSTCDEQTAVSTIVQLQAVLRASDVVS